MCDPDAPEAAADVTEVIRWKHAHTTGSPYGSYESGLSARQAQTVLRCGNCVLQSCIIKDMLSAAASGKPYQTHTPEGQHSAEQLLSLLAMSGRETELSARSSTPVEEIADELQGMNTMDVAAELPTVTLNGTQKNTPAVEVIDASSIINSGNIRPAPPEQLTLLFQKLTALLTERDDTNQLQLYNLNTSMVSSLYAQPKGGAVLYEVRRGGKSRLYVMGCPPTSNRQHDRAIIIGSHGDNPQDQDNFISTIIRDKEKPTHKFRI